LSRTLLYIYAKYRTSQKSGYPLGERPFDICFDAELTGLGAKKGPGISRPVLAAKAAYSQDHGGAEARPLHGFI
jgi:hypothetical protein